MWNAWTHMVRLILETTYYTVNCYNGNEYFTYKYGNIYITTDGRIAELHGCGVRRSFDLDLVS